LFAEITGARWSDVFPDFIEPCHPTQHPNSPRGERWVHEIKVDGYRCELHIWHGAVTAVHAAAMIGQAASHRL
jgi:ATP-dependent DNA ligase